MKLIARLFLFAALLPILSPAQFLMRPQRFAGADYTPNTAHFAGDGQCWMEPDTTLFPSDGNTFYFSAWIKPGGTETLDTIYVDSTDGVGIILTSSDILMISCDTTTNATCVDLRSTATIDRTGNVWTHVFIRFDRAVDNQGEIYVNGTAGTTIATFLSTAENANPVDISAVDSAIGGNVASGTSPFEGCMADVWISSGNTYSNITVGDFYSAGNPVDLGATGTGPDGSQPVVFLKGNSTGFNVNSGSGVSMVKKGTTAFTACSTAP